MIIEITEQVGHVSAMGHKVSIEQGGEAELRRRCFEALSRLNVPPDEVQFARVPPVTRLGDINQAPVPAGSTRPALPPPPPDAPDPDPPRAPLLTPAETPRAKRRPGR